MAVVELPIEVEEFLSWLVAEKARSENTLSAYRRDLRGYTEWLSARGTSVLEVGAVDISAFIGVSITPGHTRLTRIP